MPKWTPELDRMLFLIILNHQDVKVDTKAAATMLEEQGVSCTQGAVVERLKKLKKMAKGGLGSIEDGNDGPSPSKSAKSTPAKKSAGAKGTGKGNPKSAKRVRYDSDEEEDVEEASDAPIGRVKMEKVKEEMDDEA